MKRQVSGGTPGHHPRATTATTVLTSAHHEADAAHGTAPLNLRSTVAAALCLPYGPDYPDLDAWCDVDGHVYYTDNPPMLRIRRALDRVMRRFI